MASFVRSTCKLIMAATTVNCSASVRPLCPLKCTIVLGDPILRPPHAITGEVTLINPESKAIYHHGIVVQLEAMLNARHEVNSTHGRGVYSTLRSLFEVPDNWTTRGTVRARYTYSPIRQDDVMGNCRQLFTVRKESQEPVGNSFYSAKAGEKTTYPFRLEFPANMHELPTPFVDKYGKLKYVVAAYIKTRHIYYDIAGEKVMKFGGYNSLSRDVRLLPPLRHKSGFKKSFLSTENSVTATLNVENGEGGGFLRGESVPFTLTLENPKGFTVMEITVALLRNVKHKFENGGIMKKEIGKRVASSSLHREVSKALSLVKTGRLMIPQDVGVTYIGSEYYNVTFHLQFEVKLAEFGKPLGGFVDIIVGSDRFGEGRRGSFLEIEGGGAARSRSSSFNRVPERETQASISNATRGVDDAVGLNRNSTPRLPGQLLPSYSQLFPRSNSLETLPPHYDDLRND